MADAFSHISEESEDTTSISPEAAAPQPARGNSDAGATLELIATKNRENNDVPSTETQRTTQLTKSNLPKRFKQRSVSMCEGAETRGSHRSILRNAHLGRVRPMVEKSRSLDLQLDKPESVEATNEREVIEQYYQRNQATTNSLQDKTLETIHRSPEHRHRVSMVSRRSRHSEIVMLSPKIRERKNFTKSFYWLAANHKRIGFRHIIMLLLVLTYTLLGALMFYLIESYHERHTVVIRKEALDLTILGIATEMTNKVNDPNVTVSVTLMEDYIKRAYITLLEQESAYKGSTFYKSEDPDNNYKWTFGSAVFFSMNVYTATGYGSIAPESIAGRSCVIMYGFIFVPLTVVVIRDLGQWTLVHMTKIYARLLIMFRRARGFEETKDDELICLPIIVCIGIMLSYLMFASLFIYEYDALSGPPGSGMDFFHSFYFSFVSMSTIGLGDIMPNNVTFAPIITVLFFFGMPILKVVNRSTYICVENGVFGTMTVVENQLDSCWAGVQPSDSEMQPVPSGPSMQSRRIDVEDPNGGSFDEEASQLLNNFTIRSIATFMRSHSDVYGGDFGRVNLRRSDLLPPHSDTVRSMSISPSSRRAFPNTPR